MGDIVGPSGTPRRHGPFLAGQQLRRRPVSAPLRRQSALPGSSPFTGATKSNRQQEVQQQRRRRRPETASGSGCGGRGGADFWGRDRGWGGIGGRGGVDGQERFECLQARLAKTVEGSSNFVDDIRRLRKAGGLYHHDENAGCSGYGSWSRTRRAAGAENARARRADAAGGAAAAPAGGKASLRRGVGADGHAGSRGVAGTGGWSTAFAPRPVCTVGGVEPLALARELGIQTIVDRITRAIVHDERSRAPETRGGTGGRSAGRRVDGAGGGQEHDRAVEAGLAVTVGNIESYGGAHDGDHARLRSSPHAPSPANQREQVVHFAVTEPPRAARSFTSSPPPPGGHGHGANRTRHPEEDIERLRRVVRNTMSSPQWPPTSASSTSLYDGGAPLAGGERCGTHLPQWSQKHEACLADMRRRLRESGSPLVRAKDPAVLLGALLRRQGALIRLLDEAVLSLEDTAEALDALVSVSTRLKLAGVSADALFTRAGVVKPGAAGSLGHAPAAAGAGAAGGGRTTKSPGGGEASSKVRRCTIKRIHVEIHRVLSEAASFREFKIALSACVRGGGGGGRGGGNDGGSGVEWITVDQLDHALRTCHLTRRALDPQGASHPPLTGKRVARFLEEMERSSGSKAQPPVTTGAVAAAAATAAGTSQNAANILLGNERQPRSLTGRGASKRGVPAKQRRQGRQGRRAKMARTRAGRWNDIDRDLAERELAAVVVERQKKFVEGYVQERRRYLGRRVSAQREGHGGFQREKVPVGPGGRPSNKVTEAEKAEFSEAVARTKIVLKLLETRVALSSFPPPSGGGVGDASGRFPSSTGNGNTADSEAKRCSVGATRNESNANARRGRRRQASAAAAAANSNNQALSPNKKQGGAIKSAAAAAGDDKSAKRNMKQVLRTSTEAYSDRVGHHGGGAARLHASNNSRRGGGGGGGAAGGVSGRITAGSGGERGRMFAAAQTVQAAYRRRMFHRFVWAQAYLRSPAHAFGLFKRCMTVLRGADAAKAAAAAAAAARSGAGAGVGGTPGGIPSATTTSRAPADDVTSIDAWPELPGFCLSLPHHVHAADPVFLRYVRWRRREISNFGDCFDERIKGATAATPPSEEAAAVVAPPPTAYNQDSPSQQPQQQEPPPDGARLFEKKHPVRTEAVRSMLVDLRVPFLPGALDSALEDLERTIAREGGGGTGVYNAVIGGGSKSRRPGGDGRSDHDAAGSAAAGTSEQPPGNGSGGRAAAGSGRLGQHGAAAGISFAGWFCWWVRHLPFDPASTGCLLKTVRCAKALHVAEISAAAGEVIRWP